ncbi:ABC transporter substrate-binding protein [Burkholderia cepacia]|uniref:ABC transporter substrate-binding protein n=1 Tax=Burkholderia cepacia TaxID=292 RepID=UPI002AB610F9|nr:ABC transporter substrate-binding protein [Burkholderia cepacia]
MDNIHRRDFNRALGALLMAGIALPGVTLAQGASREATLRVVWPFDTSSLDAAGIGVQRSTWAVSLHVYDRLVTYAVHEGPNGTREYDPNQIAPELAERWEVAEDGRTMTFHLRRDATFHDGTPVTAEDARWSIARALAVPAAAGIMRIGGVSGADQLRVLDEHTFEVKLREPNRYGLAVFTIPFAAIINSKLARARATAQDPWATEWLKTNAAGGGAYQVSSFVPEEVLLNRFERWVSGPLPAMRQVIFRTVPESTLRAALVERRSADLALEIPPTDFDAVAKRGSAQALAIPMRNHMDFVALNSDAAPFNDARVRQAVAWALPYEGIFTYVFRSRGVPLFGGKEGVKGGVFPQADAFTTDLDKAKALLKAAGLQGGFSTSLGYSVAKSAYFDLAALAIRDSLEKIGVHVSIERLPGAQFDERVARRNYGLLLENRVAWLSLPDYWMRAFYTGTGTSNLGNYRSANLQQMLRDLPADAPPDEYAARTREMVDLVLNDVPLVPLRQGAVEVILARGVSGYTYWFHGLPDARSIRRS